MREKARRPLRFLLAGGVNTLFGLGVYPLLLAVAPALHYLVALGVAQMLSLCFAFTTHKLFVFRSRGNILREFLAFSSFYLSTYAANWLALPLLVEVAGLKPVVAQFCFAIPVVVGSYFWHSRVSFRSRS
ncbi:GtrA family protein [Sandaracinobacter sp. RS1-74]|uniref:GtrA family protein n=1 Tax=Sandaracinobacteroides sayramensis TaxID=2913411 RepID=UPI001EDC00FA|nr:GtrA family protein [Sandaracinobacteroides sayramensis]MCG2840503.1 GtrA family protein [Sandaracinobacteroides sayramensis]